MKNSSYKSLPSTIKDLHKQDIMMRMRNNPHLALLICKIRDLIPHLNIVQINTFLNHLILPPLHDTTLSLIMIVKVHLLAELTLKYKMPGGSIRGQRDHISDRRLSVCG